MTMRLQEVHPALVHYPITLLPVVLSVDLAGRVTDNRTLLRLGAGGMVAVSGGAAAAAVSGLVAQEVSRFDDDAYAMLVTHRNLNVGLVGLTAWMAVRRQGMSRPSLGYLMAGCAGLGAMIYSAYLGGRMVYGHGVGVSAAGGLREEQSPPLLPETAREVARLSLDHLRRGLREAGAALLRAELLPWLTRSRATATPAEPWAEPARGGTIGTGAAGRAVH